MKLLVLVSAIATLLAASVAPVESDAAEIFGYTHMQSSPLTLSAGRLAIGTSVAYGVTDFLQIGTNVIDDIYKIANVNAKLGMVELEEFALAPTVVFQTYNLHDIVDTNPDLRTYSWLPGLTAAFAVSSNFAIFAGGNLNYSHPEPKTENIVKSGYYRGAQIGSDLSLAYNSAAGGSSKKRQPSASSGIGNVVSAGVTYDLTYKVFGIGLSHHWPGFRLGAHVYPNADRNQVMPIVGVGASVDL
jgi:hypothetical protein